MQNSNCIPKFCRKINWKQVRDAYKRYGLKELSAKTYTEALRQFCKYANLQPYNFSKVDLEQIEDWMTDFIADNRDTLAPKYLNVIFNSVKRWCYIQKMLKSTKLFKEIKFDKASRKTSGLMESMLETRHVKTCFKIADLEDQIDVGLYGLVGLRPRLISQLRVKDIYAKNYEIKDGTFRFTLKPPIMIIPRTYKGNKGNITFMVFIPTKLAELIEMRLNANGTVTPQTKISEADNAREVYYKMKKLLRHKAVGFKGRPYLLRSFADKILRRLIEMKNQKNLKEFLMGHKGDISAIYQIRGMTEEEEQKYRSWYLECCDKWISEQIFETKSKAEIDKAELLAKFAKQLGASDEEITQVSKAFQKSEINMTEFETKLTELTSNALNTKMEQHFEQMFLAMNAKHNNKKAK